MKKEHLYFKFLNKYGKGDQWWIYMKIIKHNDDDTCQVFRFERPLLENHFIFGMDRPYRGAMDTNKYSTYADLFAPCTKEEFESELKSFMESLETYMDFIRCSP